MAKRRRNISSEDAINNILRFLDEEENDYEDENDLYDLNGSENELSDSDIENKGIYILSKFQFIISFTYVCLKFFSYFLIYLSSRFTVSKTIIYAYFLFLFF